MIESYYMNKLKIFGYVKNFEFLLGKVENNIYMLSDQDDFWLPEKVEMSYKKLIYENVDLVFTDLEVVDENLTPLYSSFFKIKKFYNKIRKDYKNKYRGLRLNNYITGCTIISKKKFLKDIIPIPTSYYIKHDYWIAIIISLQGKIACLEQATIKYRQHAENQIGTKTKSTQMNNVFEIRDLFIDVKIDLFSTYKNIIKLFCDEDKILIDKALNYFVKLKKGEKIKFYDQKIFYELYKYENLKYFIINFMILNFPNLVQLFYKKGAKK